MIFVRSMKRYSLGKPKRYRFLKLSDQYICVDYAYSDFIYRFVEAIHFIAPTKMIKVKANSKASFDNQIISAIQRRYKLYKKFAYTGLETDKDNFKVSKMHSQKMILKKKKSYFEEELAKNRSKTKEFWKVLKSLGLSSDKAKKSKISLKMTIQFKESTGKIKYFQKLLL